VKHDVSQLSFYHMEKNSYQYKLTVADNGIGIPEEIDLGNADSLGLQLVNTLVEQIDGCIELKRNDGTEFTIRFRDVDE
jgi:two-component sensor histidine kinase